MLFCICIIHYQFLTQILLAYLKILTIGLKGNKMCHHTFTLSYEMHFHLPCHYLNNDLCTPWWCRSIYPPTTTLISYSERTSTFNEEKHHFKLLFIKSKSSRYYGTHNLSLILTITQIPIELCKIVCWLNLSNSHSSLNLIGRET